MRHGKYPLKRFGQRRRNRLAGRQPATAAARTATTSSIQRPTPHETSRLYLRKRPHQPQRLDHTDKDCARETGRSAGRRAGGGGGTETYVPRFVEPRVLVKTISFVVSFAGPAVSASRGRGSREEKQILTCVACTLAHSKSRDKTRQGLASELAVSNARGTSRQQSHKQQINFRSYASRLVQNG